MRHSSKTCRSEHIAPKFKDLRLSTLLHSLRPLGLSTQLHSSKTCKSERAAPQHTALHDLPVRAHSASSLLTTGLVGASAPHKQLESAVANSCSHGSQLKATPAVGDALRLLAECQIGNRCTRSTGNYPLRQPILLAQRRPYMDTSDLTLRRLGFEWQSRDALKGTTPFCRMGTCLYTRPARYHTTCLYTRPAQQGHNAGTFTRVTTLTRRSLYW